MKFFESFRSSQEENPAESEIGGDKSLSKIESSFHSRISEFKESHPSLVKIIREGEKYATLFSALAVLNVPQAMAGENDFDKLASFDKKPIVITMDTLSLDAVNKIFDKFKFKPEGFRAEASSHLEQRNKKDVVRDLDTASVPDTAGDIGDFDVVASFRSIQRETKEEGTDGPKNVSERILSSDVEIARVSDENIVERAPALKKMSGTALGRSKKGAILAAIGTLARQKETWIRNAVCINQKSSQKGGERESSSRTTEATASDSFVYLHNIKVISLTEVNVDGDIYWEAQVEAQG